MRLKHKSKFSFAAVSLVLIIALIAIRASIELYHSHMEDKAFEDLPAAVLHDYTTAETGSFDVAAKQYFVYDASSGTMLCEYGQSKIIYPASTTKLLTALVALEYLAPDELITAGDEVTFIAEGSSIAYIKSGMILSTEMLIEGMLLPSGNDAAYALAAAAGRKIADDSTLDANSAIEKFVDEMNAYAAEIGLCGSHFTTPDGYCGSEHYSTLEDMAIISYLAYQNDIIAKYSSLSSDSVVYASGEINEWFNTNECINTSSEYYNEKIVGLKTGSLDNYYDLIAVAADENETYIIGVFGLKSKEQRFEDANIIADALLR